MKRLSCIIIFIFSMLAAVFAQEKFGAHETKTKEFNFDEGHKVKAELKIFKPEIYNFRTNPITPTPDLRGFSYATYSKTSSDQIIINGVKQKRYDEVGRLIWSPDSRRYAYVAKSGDKLYLVIDGKEQEVRYSDIEHISFSPDSSRIAYIGRISYDEYVVVVDGKELGTYENVEINSMQWMLAGLSTCFFFSPDSKHVAYVATKGKKEKVFVDSKEIGEYDEVEVHSLMFVPESDNVTYCYKKKDEKQYMVFGASEKGPYDKIEYFYMNMSMDGKRYAFPAMRDDKWYIVTQDKKLGPFEKKPELSVSSFSTRMVYAIPEGDRSWDLYIDGEVICKTSFVRSAFAISSDGEHVAYIKSDAGKHVVMLDNNAIQEFDNSGIEKMMLLPYDDFSRFAIYVRKDKKDHIYVDGKEGKAYKRVGKFKFSPDGKHFIYASLESNSKTVLVVDGKETLELRSKGAAYSFSEDGSIYGMTMEKIPSDEELDYESSDWWEKEVKLLRIVLFKMVIE